MRVEFGILDCVGTALCVSFPPLFVVVSNKDACVADFWDYVGKEGDRE